MNPPTEVTHESTQDRHWPARDVAGRGHLDQYSLLAHAGGPTSVFIVSPSAQRATGLYHTEPGYDELIQAIGGGDGQPRARSANPPVSSSTKQPRSG